MFKAPNSPNSKSMTKPSSEDPRCDFIVAKPLQPASAGATGAAHAQPITMGRPEKPPVAPGAMRLADGAAHANEGAVALAVLAKTFIFTATAEELTWESMLR